jgi:DNA-directed RNA polymerase specialized sigma24 family protein
MPHHFATTKWTLILNAEATAPEVRQAAMAELCQAYWVPLYAFARGRGASHDDAADLTQGFFLHLIDKHALRGLDRSAIRFRAYLLASFKNFEADHRDRALALKRGGGLFRVTFDPVALERSEGSISRGEDPERLYARQWALTVLDRARERVRSSYVKAGTASVFAALSPYAMSRPDTVADLARDLDLSEGAVRVALHRLRRRFGAELRAEVAATVGDPCQVEGELRFLLDVLAGPRSVGSV